MANALGGGIAAYRIAGTRLVQQIIGHCRYRVKISRLKKKCEVWGGVMGKGVGEKCRRRDQDDEGVLKQNFSLLEE